MPGPTKQDEIDELRRRAEQCRAEAMDASTPELQRKLEKQAEDFERAAVELERKS